MVARAVCYSNEQSRGQLRMVCPAVGQEPTHKKRTMISCEFFQRLGRGGLYNNGSLSIVGDSVHFDGFFYFSIFVKRGSDNISARLAKKRVGGHDNHY